MNAAGTAARREPTHSDHTANNSGQGDEDNRAAAECPVHRASPGPLGSSESDSASSATAPSEDEKDAESTGTDEKCFTWSGPVSRKSSQVAESGVSVPGLQADSPPLASP